MIILAIIGAIVILPVIALFALWVIGLVAVVLHRIGGVFT